MTALKTMSEDAVWVFFKRRAKNSHINLSAALSHLKSLEEKMFEGEKMTVRYSGMVKSDFKKADQKVAVLQVPRHFFKRYLCPDLLQVHQSSNRKNASSSGAQRRR